MYAFDYKKVSSLEEAESVFGSADDGTYLAGGMTLIPTLKQRLAQPSDVIDLSSIDGLSGISVDGNSVSVGAMTCHADVAASADVQKAIPALAALANLIGDPQVRTRGTIGGSIAHNAPAAAAPLRTRGQELLDDRHRLHGRTPSLGIPDQRARNQDEGPVTHSVGP